MVMIMKQLIIFILVGCMFMVSGCQSETTSINGFETEPDYLDATWEKATDPSQNETSVADTTSVTEERSDETTPSQSGSTEETVPEDTKAQTAPSVHKKEENKPTKTTTPQAKPTPSKPKPTQSKNEPTVPKETKPNTEPTVTVPTQPETKPKDTEPTQPASKPTEPEPKPSAPETKPTEPTGCSHDWKAIHHEEKGHWQPGIVCDCGWTVCGKASELVSKWNAHSASYPAEVALFHHGGYGSADKWIVDEPAYDEWVCRHCGEPKP